MADVTLRGVHKAFGDNPIVRGVDLEIGSGEFMVLVGPSGCGKTTLLRLLAGLEQCDQGEVLIDGKVMNDAAPRERNVGMVFQSYALYPHMTVRENLAFALELRKTPKAELDARVNEAAQMLELEKLLERRPKQLSGGQRQRVAIGRAIVRRPSVFLFDEPLSNLDAALRVQMRGELMRLHARLQSTMIYVTHDQVEAMTLATRLAVFNLGKLQQVGKPLDLYARPANKFVAGFLGSPGMNFLRGRVGKGAVAGDGFSLALSPRYTALEGREVIAGVRPQALTLSAQGGVRGEIEAIERLGTEGYAYLRTKVGTVVARFEGGGAELKVGDAWGAACEAASVLLFDAASEEAIAVQP
ncbi:MAG: ABC transporter ATP-binding protein [Deltaproteobacteria bacterium]|nr:ABC transporter ATP-binding protein [Deltaproteobacteria bacterium]